MKKKGFTLIELLAVIVILAIIAVIVVTVIGNIINNSKRKAAENSLYGYIEAVELYQTRQFLLRKNQLQEAIYNVAKETSVDDKSIDALNKLVDMKGTKPTGGTVSITKKGNVSVSTLCINDYLVEYTNSKANVISDDCGDIGLIINYSIDNPDWAQTKTLTVEYPEGKYDYYLKLDSGSAKLNDKELTVGEETKVENPVDLTLTENSEISTWLMKGTEKLNLRTYKETKIDNVELISPTITTTAATPLLKSSGIVLETTLTLDYTKVAGTSAYYSLNNGKTWNKYTGQVSIKGTNVQAKLVRDESKRESEINTKSISSSSNTIYSSAYDNNKSTCSNYLYSTVYYLNVDESMWGQSIDVLTQIYGKAMQYDVSGATLSTTSFSVGYNSASNIKMTILEGTKKIGFKGDSSSNPLTVCEIKINDNPIISSTNIYPVLKTSGIEKAYQNVEIKYFDTAVKKLYKIGENVEWNDYTAEVKLNIGETIYAKSINDQNVESINSNYLSNISNSVDPTVYDKNNSTCSNYLYSTVYYLNVDESMWGQSINVLTRIYGKAMQYDASGATLSTKIFSIGYKGASNVNMTILEGTKRIGFNGDSSSNPLTICEITNT